VQPCGHSDGPPAYHARRYGKFAIGFHRDAAIKHGFNPVFYTLVTTGVLRSLYDGFAQIGRIDMFDVKDHVAELSAATCTQGHEVEPDTPGLRLSLELEMDDLERYLEAALAGYEKFLAYIKTFDENEFAEIYTEREWRSTRPFRFSMEDVAMIVMPRGDDKNQFFDRFMAIARKTVRLPRSIPVVPWDDLLEY
jgi:hypothetical protein